MPPKNSSNETETETDTETDDNQPQFGPLQTYQVTYVDIDGRTRTILIEATDLFTDSELKEFWKNGIMQIAIDESAIHQIRNVSALDMPSQ